VSTAPKMKPAKAAGKQNSPEPIANGNAASAAAFVLGLKVGRPRKSVFLRMLLSDETHRQAFEDLCDQGVPAELLESSLMVICLSARRYGAAPPTILKDEKKGLPAELDRLANMVEDANKNAFGPARWVKEPHKTIYGILPNIMRCYGATYLHVERSVDSLRHRRMTGAKMFTMQLMALVESFTGTPNYPQVSTLLIKAFTATEKLQPSIAGKLPHPTQPKFFDADALAKLHRSSVALMPSNYPRRHHRSSIGSTGKK
jgi:hypothetical protein